MLSRRCMLAGSTLIFLFTAAGAGAAELTFVLPIEKGRLPGNMRLIRVKQGDTVKLQWSTDQRIVLHLHGYDIAKEVVPGAVTEMIFVARATGRFPVAPHLEKESSGGHVHGDAIVTIEVYP
jgi:hypothetical protein